MSLMTAAEIIEEIKRLPAEERAKVIQVATRTPEQLSPEELGQLAQRMAETTNASEADELQEKSFEGSTVPSRMPKVRRQKVPEALLRHLLLRVRERKISPHQITELGRWLDNEPTVPDSKWFRRFGAYYCLR